MASYLSSQGYQTGTVGKSHFWTANGENHSTVPAHGYSYRQLYDGLGDGMDAQSGELDDYDVWFAEATGMNKSNPLASCGLDWNSWRGCASGYAYDEELHPTAWVGATAQAWLEQQQSLSVRAGTSDSEAASAPYFFKVSFHRPHSPYDPPQRLYNATNDVPTQVSGGNWDSIFTTNGKDCGPSNADAWCGAMPAGDAYEARRSYRASVAFVDEQIGAVLASVNLSSTWVIYLSDHGDGQGDHGLWRKGYPYQLSAHVPGIVRWPDGYAASIPRGSTSDELAEVRDIFPTAASIAGAWPLPAGHAVEGVPLTCLVGGPAAPTECAGFAAGTQLANEPASSFAWRSSLDGEHDVVFNATIHWNSLLGSALTQAAPAGHRVKFIFWAYSATEQLFDLTADPHEMNDLAGEPAWKPELQAWRAAMAQQFQREGRGPAWVSADGQLQRRVAGQLCSPNFPARQYC